jgi:1-acyl-sn-glycerol-3-phosphate acyltransferase
MVLAVAPEATRAATREWKSGFYHIAHASGAPLVVSVLDYGTKTITLAGALTPSGDYAADLPRIKAFYDGAKGLRVGRFIHRDAARQDPLP